MDRIDIHIDVPAVKFRELRGDAAPETDSSAVIRDRVIRARQRQQQRFAGQIPLETVIDVATLAESFYTLVKQPGWVNAAFFVWIS